MSVDIAVVPVAGPGTRLLPATKSQPKEMLPVGRKPVVQYVFEELTAARLRRILFVTGPGKTSIENHFDINEELVQMLREKGREELLEALAFERAPVHYFYTRQRRRRERMRLPAPATERSRLDPLSRSSCGRSRLWHDMTVRGSMTTSTPDLIVLHEHPDWQKPLFSALQRRGVSFVPFDVTQAAFTNVEPLRASLYFNQASPSAYLRGHTRAVPLALAYMRSLELLGARVLNGADVFALELSKSAQATLLRTLGIDCPRSITFNDVRALRAYDGDVHWPALLKPDQGGSGARIQVVESLAKVEAIFSADPSLWLPDNLFLLQEYLPHDPEQGIVRLEFLGGELLYAMRVKTHGRFNLCPSPICNPDESTGVCAEPADDGVAAAPVEFFPCPEVPPEAVETARRIARAARLDVGGIEYLETHDGRRVFYDINANSNLRPSVAAAFGFDPFERVVDFLVGQLQNC